MSFFTPEKHISPKKGAIIGGWIYWPVYLLFLGVLLALLLPLLGLDVLSTEGNLALNMIYFTVNFIAVLLIFRNFLLESFREARGNWKRIITSALLGLALEYILAIWISFVYSGFQLLPENLNQEGVTELMEMSPVFMTVATVIFAPLTEECLVRGLVFGPLAKKLPFLGYILSILIFAGLHVIGGIGTVSWLDSLLSFIQYLPACLALTWAYHRSGNILSSLLLHSVINLIAVLAQLMV